MNLLISFTDINYLPLYRNPLKIDKLVHAMHSDKKVSLGKLRFVLMRDIGDAIQKEVESTQLVERVLMSVGASK